MQSFRLKLPRRVVSIFDTRRPRNRDAALPPTDGRRPLRRPYGCAGEAPGAVLLGSRTDSHSFANLRTYEWEIINTRKYSKIRVFLRMYFIRSALLVGSTSASLRRYGTGRALPPHKAGIQTIFVSISLSFDRIYDQDQPMASPNKGIAWKHFHVE